MEDILTSIQFLCLSYSLPLRRRDISSLSSGRRFSITKLDKIYKANSTHILHEVMKADCILQSAAPQFISKQNDQKIIIEYDHKSLKIHTHIYNKAEN